MLFDTGGISSIPDSVSSFSEQPELKWLGGSEPFTPFQMPSATNEMTVGPEDVLGEFEQSLDNSSSQISQIPDGGPVDLGQMAEKIISEASYLKSELGKPDPDELGMLRSLLNLPAGEEVQVLSDLRTNGDVGRLLDSLFSNPATAAQMGQLADKLQSVADTYPGIQDIIDDIRSRLG